MDRTSACHDILFPRAGGFAEADYLGFLAQRVPRDIAEQLTANSWPELGASDSVSISDVTDPLSSKLFPTNNLWELSSILYSTIIRYNVSRIEHEAHDPYKLIYAISLYLYCFLRAEGPEPGAHVLGLSILADVSPRLDLETRLQVCRFVGSLVPTIYAGATTVSALMDATSVSAALSTLSVILGSAVGDLSVLAEDAMKTEKVGSAWAEDSKDFSEPAREWIADLRRSISEVYGSSGKMRQVSDRFLLAIEAGKKGVEKDNGWAK